MGKEETGFEWDNDVIVTSVWVLLLRSKIGIWGKEKPRRNEKTKYGIRWPEEYRRRRK